MRQSKSGCYVYSSTFWNCWATGGGMICAECVMVIEDSLFDFCYAEWGGGAIYMKYTGVTRLNQTLRNCSFNDCRSDQVAGAIMVFSRTPGDSLYTTMTECTFTFYRCFWTNTDEWFGGGGAIEFCCGFNCIDRCRFDQCTTTAAGGAMCCHPGGSDSH